MNFQWVPRETPLVILAEGCFGETQSKTALGVIRYGEWPITAVLDSTRTGQTVRDITGMPCGAPIVGSIQEAMPGTPKALLLGTAPAGGQLPESWKQIIRDAIENGLHVINGLHTLLGEIPEFVKLAKKHGVELWDVRDPRYYGFSKFEVINYQKPRPENVRVVTMVGTDCAIGKMYSALELHHGMKKRGASSEFVATGQTGIMITGSGVPLDRVIGDFMAGGLEVCIQEAIEKQTTDAVQWLFIEGQGSLMHPAYSGVTLSLLHGSNPDAMVLCHKAELKAIRNYTHLPLPPLSEVVAMYEQTAAWVRPPGSPKARVAGISVNTAGISEEEARALLRNIEAETGLPATDPVRFGVDNLLDALENAFAPTATGSPA